MRRDALEKAFPKGVVIRRHQRFAEKVSMRISRDRLVNVNVVVDKNTFERISSVLSTLQSTIRTFITVILIVGFSV